MSSLVPGLMQYRLEKRKWEAEEQRLDRQELADTARSERIEAAEVAASERALRDADLDRLAALHREWHELHVKVVEV
ncbi:MAG TPA: hypothetical protein PLV68_09910, partial [Ilumatobacteraceae bacterium]|nr:hypothetical protein [Ilumatobacteraceae bacterium]